MFCKHFLPDICLLLSLLMKDYSFFHAFYTLFDKLQLRHINHGIYLHCAPEVDTSFEFVLTYMCVHTYMRCFFFFLKSLQHHLYKRWLELPCYSSSLIRMSFTALYLDFLLSFMYLSNFSTSVF